VELFDEQTVRVGLQVTLDAQQWHMISARHMISELAGTGKDLRASGVFTTSLEARRSYIGKVNDLAARFVNGRHSSRAGGGEWGWGTLELGLSICVRPHVQGWERRELGGTQKEQKGSMSA